MNCRHCEVKSESVQPLQFAWSIFALFLDGLIGISMCSVNTS